MRSTASALLLLILAACASRRPATQVDVIVDAEPMTRGEAVRLEIVVRGGPPGTTFVDARTLSYDGPLLWPYDFVVVPAASDVGRLFEIEATAYDAGERIISQARVRAGYVSGERRALRVTIEDACRGVVCPSGLGCRAGRCVVIDPTTDRDAGTGMDANVDGGPPGPCTTNADCSDGNACNGVEQCRAGACVPGVRLDCDDHVGCTIDTCDGMGCVHRADDTTCTAGSGGHCDATNDCQYADCTPTNCVPTGCQSATCSGTTCVRSFSCMATETCCGGRCVPSGCDDAEGCTTDFCDTTAGECMHVPHAGPCDDRDACTSGDSCDASGACRGGSRVSCEDTNECTDDRCDPGTGCAHDFNAASCDDGDACTVGDRCGSGACVAGAPMACADAVACTTDTCSAGACVHTPVENCGAGMRCDATLGCQPIASCDAMNCQPTPGACETATCSGTTCVRATTCGAGQTCCAGVCVEMDCADTNPCTDDACGATGCVHVEHTRGCDDGNACTTGDHCSAGACTSTPVDCDDGRPCTTDVCTTGAGGMPSCLHTNLIAPCDDGDDCTQGDVCRLGICYPGRFCGASEVCCPFGGCQPSGTSCP